jgi:hypothetical protein
MIVKDRTLGVLLIVISMFPYKFADYLISPKDWWITSVVFVCMIVFYGIFSVGWKLIFQGVQVDGPKE